MQITLLNLHDHHMLNERIGVDVTNYSVKRSLEV